MTWIGDFQVFLTPIQKQVWKSFDVDLLVGFGLGDSVDILPKVGTFSGAIPADRSVFAWRG